MRTVSVTTLLPSSVKGSNWKMYALWGMLLGGFGFAFQEPMREMMYQWWTENMYSYGFLIPVISLYLVWLRRKQLFETPIQPSPFLGGMVLGLAFLMLLIGHGGSFLALMELSLIPALIGLVLILFGLSWLRVLLLPIAYLLFMIPIWEFLTGRLHAPFQDFSAWIGMNLLQGVGIPVYREGIYLHLPEITLEVAQACSGVNYLIAVLAIGIPLAFLYLETWKKRLLLLLSAIGIAILANGVRVALIGFLVHYHLTSDLHGPYHMLQGLFVSFVGFGVLFGGLYLLARSSRPLSEKYASTKCWWDVQQTFWENRGSMRVGTLVLVLSGIGGFLWISDPKPVQPSMPLAWFPSKVGNWHAVAGMDGGLEGMGMPADQVIDRVYQNARGQRVYFRAEWFSLQSQGKEMVRLDSFGWLEADAASDREFRVSNNSVLQFATKRWILHLGESRTEGVLWFGYAVGNRWMTSPWKVKGYTVWNTLFHHQSEGMRVLLFVPLSGGTSLEEALSFGERFLKEASPWLASFIPSLS